ncbi:FMN-binding negative transcriptional regulator [Loktanella sp. TSTF-M6]|uniref:FMN-binding negative transcriptional regulator n=1 Tax=Loktanella gaetbuli TaxID=2881335 RepID=A0ABS8BVB3_9RHOB|nr:FMN-binding negative transcriptional regulator [Loktanella gaetbuli]MCB5199645.1 FMN-binding negative transcriptional regulator [Loktanella gaetbuli]
MYVPPAFAEDRPEVLHKAIRDIQFAALVTQTAEGMQVTHAPLLLRDTGPVVTLETHVARGNPHAGALCAGHPTVAIFQGPQAYISPSFYPSKAEHGKVVPTWTYIVVHAHGTVAPMQDDADLLQHLHDLTDHNERPRAEPWSVNDAPDGYIAARQRGIIGLRMTVDRIEGAWKINQNKPEADRNGTADGLAASGEMGRALADVLRAAR